MYNVHFLYRYRTVIHYLKRGTLCLFLLCMFIPTFYFDIYLNSYLFFCIASSIVVLSSIFLTITGHYKFTLLEIGVLIVIVIELFKLIIQQEIIIYYQALLKMVILLCWMVNLRNLIRNRLLFRKKKLILHSINLVNYPIRMLYPYTRPSTHKILQQCYIFHLYITYNLLLVP